MAEVGPIAKAQVDAGANRVHLPASPLMHGTGAFTTFQALFLGASIVTLVGRHFDPHELWQTVQRERVTQMAIVGDAFAKPMLRALEEAEAKGTPYDISSLQLIISSGVMWSAEVKHGLMERGNFICLRLARLERRRRLRGLDQRAGHASRRRRSSRSAPSAQVFNDQGVEVVPGSGEVGRLAVGGHIPLGYYKDESKSDATFLVIDGKRWSVPGDFASVEADGTITLLGRGSVVINSGGEKIFPEEVEEAVKVHPAVADCLVVGVPDERFGEAVIAVVSLRPGEAGDDRRAHRGAGTARALQAPAPVRDRRRGRARPERQGRLQVGQGRSREVANTQKRREPGTTRAHAVLENAGSGLTSSWCPSASRARRGS